MGNGAYYGQVGACVCLLEVGNIPDQTRPYEWEGLGACYEM